MFLFYKYPRKIDHCIDIVIDIWGPEIYNPTKITEF